MASNKDIAKLNIKLVAENQKLLAKLAQSQKETDKWKKQTEKDTEAVNLSFASVAGGVGAAATAIAAAGASAVVAAGQFAKMNTENQNAAEQAGLTVEAFNKVSFAYGRAGISADQLASQSQDLNDKLGEFLREGTDVGS